MRSITFLVTGAMLAFSAAGSAQPTQLNVTGAASDCETQFQQCLDAGQYPPYKCEELYSLCQQVGGFAAAPTGTPIMDRPRAGGLPD